jgi:hypothetical protein
MATLLRLTDLLSYKTYAQALAVSHKQINGFKWGDADVVRNDNRSDMDTNFLWALPYEDVNYEGEDVDHQLKVKEAVMVYLEPRNSELFADEDQQFQNCETRAEEILARIERDMRGFVQGNDWVQIISRLNSRKLKPVQHKIGSTPYVGFEIRLEFMDNTGMTYDANLWND